MKLSGVAKTVIAAGLLVGVLVYLVIVDLGVSAGRIHHGVSLNGELDLGGLTSAEAFDALSDLEEELIAEPIAFSIEGLTLVTCPRDCSPNGLGFHAHVSATVAEAFAVGRHGGPITALGERARAWLDGVRIGWKGRARPHRVTRLIDEWEERAAALGYTLDRARLRSMLKEAVHRLPKKKIYELPVLES